MEENKLEQAVKEVAKTGFFDEAPGKQSWIRLAGSYLLVIAGFIIVNRELKGQDIPFDTVIMLISTAFGGKLIQKIQETKK